MKNLIYPALLLFSFSALAMNEVECRGQFDGKDIVIEVEQAFPRYSFHKRANLTITDDESEVTREYQVTTRSTIGYGYVYRDLGFDLDIDTWPDASPRSMRTYFATFRSELLGNNDLQNIRCSYPFGN